MSRSKSNWNQLVDEYGNYDFTSIFATVNGVTQGELDEQLSGYVSRSGDVMSGGLFVQNDLGYAYAIEPGGSEDAKRPAGTTEFTRNGRVIAEQYWDIGEQRLNFNVRDVSGAPQLEDSLEIGRDKIVINADTDLAGELYIKGDALTETLEALSQEINYQVGLLEGKIATKYNKTGGDISGIMSVNVGGETKLTVNRLGITLGQNPTQNYHAATKKYVDDAIQNVDLTGALKFLGVRDLTTTDPDGDEEFGNIYAAAADGTPTVDWGLTEDVTEGTLVGLGENGWIVIGQVGLPDLSGYVTIIDSETADGLLSDRLDILEADSVTKTYVDTANQNTVLRLDELERDPITKQQSDEGDEALSDRIDAIEDDYIGSAQYLQDQSDLADALALKADITYVDNELTLKADKTYVDNTFLKLSGGTLTGGLDLSDNTITGVADPVDDSDAVNKSYVESQIGNYLPLTGGTLTGGLTLSGDSSPLNMVRNDITNVAKIKGSNGTSLTLDGIGRTVEIWSGSGSYALKVYSNENGNAKLRFAVKPDGSLNSGFSESTSFLATEPWHLTTKKYVDGKIADLGDVFIFQGAVDFTTEAAPAELVTGHVYSNTGTGTADASWGLTDDVAPGQLYGYGQTQWGLIGAAEVDLTGYATEGYVDSAVSPKSDKTYVDTTFLPLVGGTLTGGLDLSDNTITGVADPVEASDAVNKAYVEGGLAGYLKNDGDTVDSSAQVVYEFKKGIKFQNFGSSFDVDHGYVNIESDSDVQIKAVDDIYLKTIDGGNLYLQPSGSINVSNNYIKNVKTPTSDDQAVNKGYVDGKFDSIGDVLVFKGVLDFTTDAAPNDAATGHVYSNSGTGTPHASWGLTDDVAAGELYGLGETQWGRIGAGEVDLTGHLPLTGGTLTGNLEINNASGTSKLEFTSANAGIWYFGVERLSWYGGNVGFFEGEYRFTEVGGGNSFLVIEDAANFADAQVRYYGNFEHLNCVINKEYLQGYAMPKDLTTLPPMP